MPDKPYKNIVNITSGVSPSEVKESNEEVNLVPVETIEEPKAITEEERWEKIREELQQNTQGGK